tara:strand:- start:861 stop:1883 length:1023 start_codon:yes stop_codon:yes gene_type:complete
MISPKKVILITAGDPASISTEITIKAMQAKKINKNVNFVVVTDPILIEKYIHFVKSDIKINLVKDRVKFCDYKDNFLNIIPIQLKNQLTYGNPDTKHSHFIKNSIITSVNTYLNSIASAIVTNPINKHFMHKSGFNFEGHTDFLASISVKRKNPIMMLVTNELKTLPLTIHVPLKEVPKLITKDLIYSKIKIAVEDLKTFFNIKIPSIIVTGLNPHAGENGDFGDEEINVIKPAIDELKKLKNVLIDGPISPDTAFLPTSRLNYDLVVCMYHDQALIPIKTLDFYNGVNVTLGLDFIRTSPDHGTGFDIAGKNIANPESLISAINLAYKMSINQNNAQEN